MRRGRAPAKRELPRLPFLEGLRGIAALYVAIGHICSMSDPSQLAGRATKSPEWLVRTMAVFSYGHLAVAAFIVISGFCLQIALFSRGTGKVGSLRRFYARRAQRILPAYYGCLLFSILVTIGLERWLPGMPFDIYRPVTQDDVVSHLFLYHNFREAWMYKINGVLWSIALECQLYLFFPALVFGLNRLGRLGTVILSLGVAFCLIPLFANPMKSYVWFLPLFAAGMAAAHLAYRPNLKIGTNPINGAILGVLLLFLCVVAASQRAPIYVTDATFGLSIVCICYALSTVEKGFWLKLASNRTVVWFGTFSYSLYLMHHPILQVIFALRPSVVHDESSRFVYLMLCLPFVLAGTWGFSLLFEKPFVHNRRAQNLPEQGLLPASLPLRSAQP